MDTDNSFGNYVKFHLPGSIDSERLSVRWIRTYLSPLFTSFHCIYLEPSQCTNEDFSGKKLPLEDVTINSTMKDNDEVGKLKL
jgi:hypothetical protein